MKSLSQRTSTLLIRDDQVLLGYKKQGLGTGKYMGIGGKAEPGETIQQAAIREVQEEIGITVSNLTQVGDFTFIFPDKPHWSQQVHVFMTDYWVGDIQETDEIRPKWMNQKSLPLTNMWDDAQFWLAAVLNGHRLKGEFGYNTDLKVIKVQLEEF